MIRVGQLRRWKGHAESPGEVLLVVRLNPPNKDGDLVYLCRK